jgi:hypothetical protein
MRRLALATLTVIAVTAGASLYANTGGGPTGHGPAAFAVEKLPDGPVRITIINSSVAAKEMTRQLHEQGLPITITAIPASPQLVGTWFSFGGGGTTKADMDAMIAQMQAQEPTIDIPADVLKHGGIDLDFGRPTRKGEQPAAIAAINALSPRGKFFCLRLSGATPAVAKQKLTAAGYTVHFNPPPGAPRLTGSNVGVYDDYRAAPPAGLVARAVYDSPFAGPKFTAKDVFVTVIPPTSSTYLPNFWMNFPKSVRDTGAPDYSSCPS